MSVVSHIAAQRTNHGVPHAVSCRLLGVSESWFYKWRSRRPTATERRRAALDVKVRIVFETSARTYGSPRVCAQLRGLSNRLCEGVGSWVFSGLGLVGWGSGFRVGLGLFSSRGCRCRGFLLVCWLCFWRRGAAA